MFWHLMKFTIRLSEKRFVLLSIFNCMGKQTVSMPEGKICADVIIFFASYFPALDGKKVNTR